MGGIWSAGKYERRTSSIINRVSSSFTAASLRPDAVAMGHVLNVDHFHMSQPSFPPHPHAGFSAITWMLPWSQGGLSIATALATAP